MSILGQQKLMGSYVANFHRCKTWIYAEIRSDSDIERQNITAKSKKSKNPFDTERTAHQKTIDTEFWSSKESCDPRMNLVWAALLSMLASSLLVGLPSIFLPFLTQFVGYGKAVDNVTKKHWLVRQLQVNIKLKI